MSHDGCGILHLPQPLPTAERQCAHGSFPPRARTSSTSALLLLHRCRIVVRRQIGGAQLAAEAAAIAMSAGVQLAGSPAQTGAGRPPATLLLWLGGVAARRRSEESCAGRPVTGRGSAQAGTNAQEHPSRDSDIPAPRVNGPGFAKPYLSLSLSLCLSLSLASRGGRMAQLANQKGKKGRKVRSRKGGTGRQVSRRGRRVRRKSRSGRAGRRVSEKGGKCAARAGKQMSRKRGMGNGKKAARAG